MFFSHGTYRSCRTLVLIKNDLEFELNSFSIDSEGRHVLLDATIQGSDFLLVNIYASNDVTEQCGFFGNLNQLIENNYNNVEQKIVVGGDFNVTFDQDLDCSGGKPTCTKKNCVACIQEVRLNFDLVDIWRIRNPDCRRFTWRQKSSFIQRRLDYWLISDNYQEEVVKANIVPSINSDHLAITLHFNSINEQHYEPSYWKFNASLLDDTDYLQMIRNSVPNRPLQLVRFVAPFQTT